MTHAGVAHVSQGGGDGAADFAVFELGPERRWWNGRAIDPLPLLEAAEPEVP